MARGRGRESALTARGDNPGSTGERAGGPGGRRARRKDAGGHRPETVAVVIFAVRVRLAPAEQVAAPTRYRYERRTTIRCGRRAVRVPATSGGEQEGGGVVAVAVAAASEAGQGTRAPIHSTGGRCARPHTRARGGGYTRVPPPSERGNGRFLRITGRPDNRRNWVRHRVRIYHRHTVITTTTTVATTPITTGYNY